MSHGMARMELNSGKKPPIGRLPQASAAAGRLEGALTDALASRPIHGRGDHPKNTGMRPCAGTEDGDGDASASSFSQSEVHPKAHEEFGELRLDQQADVHSLRMFIADCDGVIKSTLYCRVLWS